MGDFDSAQMHLLADNDGVMERSKSAGGNSGMSYDGYEFNEHWLEYPSSDPETKVGKLFTDKAIESAEKKGLRPRRYGIRGGKGWYPTKGYGKNDGDLVPKKGYGKNDGDPVPKKTDESLDTQVRTHRMCGKKV